MGFYVEQSRGKTDPRSARFSRSGEGGEMEELFEQLMGGEGLEDVKGLEDFDWEGLWDSFMEGEGGSAYQEEGGVPQQAGNRPTMFGGFLRPGGSRTNDNMSYW